VHRNGVGVCGVYPFEMAETKINLVTKMARENGFPLKTSIEKE
jgi:ATP-dependent Clp protease adaptor protein ClpS